MKKAVILGERMAGLVEVPDLQPKEDWAVVKILVTAMCTEYKGFIAGAKAEFLGHEAVGEVVAVAQPCEVEVGDRVVVQPQYPCGQCELCISGEYIRCENTYDLESFLGTREGSATYAQYILKPSWLLSKIPDDISYERASLALCALGPTFTACDLTGVDTFTTVLITGAGPVGLGGVVNARFRGARVIVSELEPYRAEKARELGAEAVVDPRSEDCLEQIMDLTDGKGVDCSFDCSGNVKAQRLCLDATQRKGHFSFVGAGQGELGVQAWPDMITKGLTLHGSWHYPLSKFPQIMQVIRESPVIDDLVSHTFPMSRIQEAFETLATQKTAKVLLKPWE